MTLHEILKEALEHAEADIQRELTKKLDTRAKREEYKRSVIGVGLELMTLDGESTIERVTAVVLTSDVVTLIDMLNEAEDKIAALAKGGTTFVKVDRDYQQV